MCVTQHFLHDEVIVDRFGELFAFIGTLGLLIVSNFFVELKLRHRFVAVILAIVFKELKAYGERDSSI